MGLSLFTPSLSNKIPAVFYPHSAHKMLGGTPQNKLDILVASNSSPLTSLLNEGANDMPIESENSSGFVPHHQLPMILPDNGPKRRAETWVQDEIQSLIHLRRELNWHFNTTKSNKHLWDQISVGMREQGRERTPQNCNDKWRNLLKERKRSYGGSGSSREVSFDELEEYCREKKSNGTSKKSRAGYSVQIPDKGTDEACFLFGPSEDNDRPLNLEKNTYHDANPLDIPEPDRIVHNEFPSWNWRGTPRRDAEDVSTFGGRVISVRYRECIKRIGIDGSSEAIKEAIKSTFHLRTKQSFRLEDEDGIIRALDRNVPLGNYTLHLDDGLSVRICLCDDPNHVQCCTIEKAFYNEDSFNGYLRFRGWIGLKDSRSHRNIDSMNDLRAGELYHGQRRMQKH